MGRRRSVNISSFQVSRSRLPGHLSAIQALGVALATAALAILYFTLRLQETANTSSHQRGQNSIFPSRLRSLWADSVVPSEYHAENEPGVRSIPRLISTKRATSSATHSDTNKRPIIRTDGGVDAGATLTSQSFQSCTHWSEDDAREFANRANVARAVPALPHPIPRQILLNYGLWSVFSLPVPPSAEGADLSAAPELITSLPPPLRERVSCWLETHPPPHWRVRLWDGPSAEAFMQHFHPHLLRSDDGSDGPWRAYSRPVQRADLLRVLLVASFGGLYVDLDVRPPAAAGGKGPHPLDELWASYPTAAALLFEEAVLTPAQAAAAAAAHPIRGGAPEECQRIANYMLAAAPASLSLGESWQQQLPVGGSQGLLQGVLDLLVRRAPLPVRSDYDVLFTTGPAMLTEALHAYAADLADKAGVVSAAGGGATLSGMMEGSACGPSASDLLASAAVASSAGEAGAGADSSGKFLRQLPPGPGVVTVVRRPEDQLYFDHMTTGTWRGGGAAAAAPVRGL